ncbi:hypothetical protein GCM10009133_38690 [Cocleimonas flava]|uniref:Uncharacterized protein n=1 Tax=Cocleimonas flava TaxID=634765 RepID=A0A4R1F3D5_9GAMM|nr:DUF4286 family protein [Cocleimonas flava]TCJ88293.1 hypothetical protein EV695_0133 [Cocleimonas flava]
MIIQNTTAAELFVWTDIDPTYEQDFNQWYDREHMTERVSIDGFTWASRYRAVSMKARRYLALYRTENINVFTSNAYKQAFANQTSWSKINFERMTNTKRRVMRVAYEGGYGTGSAIGLIQLQKTIVDFSSIEQVLNLVSKTEGILKIRVLEPDQELSIPLSSETKPPTKLESAIIIETTNEPTAAAAVRIVLDQLNLKQDRGLTFNLIWELHSNDL